MKVCKDCKHYLTSETNPAYHGCGGRFDPVTGKSMGDVPAYAERGSQGLCGPLGVLFEPAQVIELFPLLNLDEEAPVVPTMPEEAAPVEVVKKTRAPRKPKEVTDDQAKPDQE